MCQTQVNERTIIEEGIVNPGQLHTVNEARRRGLTLSFSISGRKNHFESTIHPRDRYPRLSAGLLVDHIYSYKLI